MSIDSIPIDINLRTHSSEERGITVAQSVKLVATSSLPTP